MGRQSTDGDLSREDVRVERLTSPTQARFTRQRRPAHGGRRAPSPSGSCDYRLCVGLFLSHSVTPRPRQPQTPPAPAPKNDCWRGYHTPLRVRTAVNRAMCHAPVMAPVCLDVCLGAGSSLPVPCVCADSSERSQCTISIDISRRGHTCDNVPRGHGACCS